MHYAKKHKTKHVKTSHYSTSYAFNNKQNKVEFTADSRHCVYVARLSGRTSQQTR